ncbi:TIGR03745 family integrating conjugative element membrane protein [Methyloterricola oryzae]|uniref:TIGR03745 family integrating conjugative element membrane protein n=1 Tax=Methyloterricola oryzae TaxID=1495050 RepID=UPI00069BD7DB|nr:TIGR03745 family integrating conjugative element membrane protein [Methyloterricola oryzae]
MSKAWAFRARCAGCLGGVSVWAAEALSALPTPVAPSTGPAANDWLGLIKGYIKDGGLVIGLFLAVAGFLWIAWHLLADLNQVRQGRKEWGELGLSGVVGAAIFLFISYLLGQAANVI